MPKYNQPRKTWQYSNEFKVKAVQLSLIQGVQVQEVANTLDILTKWVKGKYPQKRSRRLKACSWLKQIKQWRPTLFAHW